ncbi:hypothetical protein K2173_002843 [Erythroxylum novogranatense]|uniref:Nudix hydrolase domain-containing protein n=1 Tax=Erythroxylum novogranatense TaxID=1862640 RepID=A0AAV8SQ32_9ROSI|nr:hypothetical protein K2173_002843 [Erythroxylum novogranatense]
MMKLMLLFDSNSFSVSDVALIGKINLIPFSGFYSQAFGVKLCQEFSSSRGGCYSSTSNGNCLSKAMCSVDQERRVAGNDLYDINQTNGDSSSVFSRSRKVLDAFDDEYGGVVVDPHSLPADPDGFDSALHFSLSHWKMRGRMGIWLKLPLERSELVPVAVKQGFKYHHAEQGYVMLTYWIPEGPSMLPANASHQVGVGGFVINNKNEVLVVQEKFCAPAFSGFWKIPTGFIHESEEIYMGAIREVKEETGIDTEFVEVIAFRHAHNVAFDKSDLFFVCMLKPLTTQICVDDFEIHAAKWMPLVEFMEQPLIQEDKMFKQIIDICIAQRGKRYCGLSAHHLISKFDGKQSCLYYSAIDNDHQCTGS